MIAGREVMICRNSDGTKFVRRAVRAPIQCNVAFPVGQSFNKLRRNLLGACGTRPHIIFNALPLNHLAVDKYGAVVERDFIAGQADNALDVVRLAIARQFEDGNISALEGQTSHAVRER